MCVSVCDHFTQGLEALESVLQREEISMGQGGGDMNKRWFLVAVKLAFPCLGQGLFPFLTRHYCSNPNIEQCECIWR